MKSVYYDDSTKKVYFVLMICFLCLALYERCQNMKLQDRYTKLKESHMSESDKDAANDAWFETHSDVDVR